MTGQPKYNTALYMRLSRDDGIEGDSSSIQTQREMLTRYCKENGFAIFSEYVDDGWSGTNSNRPAFQKMLSDIEDGKINCVITKDLSRLGRNYLDCGAFTELYFPEHNVRYIALTDGVDTDKGSTMDITPFKNLLNEMYAKDISNKIRSALLTRQKQGKFTGSRAPYGYTKDLQDKNHLIVDKEYAPYVRRIFELAVKGETTSVICDALTKDKVPCPSAAFAEKYGIFGDRCEGEKAYTWKPQMVRNLLKNPVYKGAIAGQKYKKLSLKSKKVKHKYSGEFIIEGTHEPLVSSEDWDLVQELITSRKKRGNGSIEKYDNIFAGLIKCADCGYTLAVRRINRKIVNGVRDCIDYQCNHYRVEGSAVCSPHRISANELYDKVLADIQRFAKAAVKDEKKMIDEMAKRLGRTEQENEKQAERDLKKAHKRLAELDKLYAALHENYVNGKVNEHNFTTLSASYETEQTELESRIRELSETIKATVESSENAEKFVELIKPYSKIRKLTQATLNTLITRIDVHEPVEINGELIQKIDVHYKHVGKIE